MRKQQHIFKKKGDGTGGGKGKSLGLLAVIHSTNPLTLFSHEIFFFFFLYWVKTYSRPEVQTGRRTQEPNTEETI